MRLFHAWNTAERLGLMTLLVGAIISACQPAPVPSPIPEPTRIVIPTAVPSAAPTPTALALPTVATLSRPSDTPRPTATPAPVFAKANENLNIRSAPTTTAPILSQLKKGDSATVLGRNAQGDWLQIALPSNSTSRGWISAAYATITGPSATLAIVDSRTGIPSTPASSSTPARVPPTASNTNASLLPPPQLVQPGTRASYAARSPVILLWTYPQGLSVNQYFQVQLSIDQGANWTDLACTLATKYQLNQPPLGYGWYLWRIIIRQGTVQGDSCISQGDASQPSEARDFEWRAPSGQTTPVPQPYP